MYICVMEQTLCVHEPEAACICWLHSSLSHVLLFYKNNIPETEQSETHWYSGVCFVNCHFIVLLSGSRRAKSMFSGGGGRASFLLAFWVSEVLAVCQSVYPRGREIHPNKLFCSSAVFHIDKRRCEGLTAWILIGVIFHSCWFGLMLMKDLGAPFPIPSKCPECVCVSASVGQLEHV